VPAAFYQLAVAQFVSGLPAKAVSSLNQAVSLDPDYAEAVLMLAELNIRRGDSDVAISSLSRLLAKRPDLAQAYYVLADAHRVKGTAEQAIPQYRRIEQLSPKDSRAPFMLGLTFLQLSKTNDARQAFERAVQIAPDFLGAVTQLAELDLDAGRSQASLDRVRRYVAAHTNDAAAYSLLAQVHLARQEEALAEEALRRTIELNPDFAGGYVGLAKIMAAGGRQPQAIERLEALLARNPKDLGALMMLGTLHEKLGNTAKARDSYEQLLRVNPRFGPALNNAANLYSQRLGDPAKGRELARRARELSPSDPYTADTLGWILFRNGEFASALALLQESAQKLPAESEVQFHLGMVHYMIGNETPARRSLERALQAKGKEFEGKPEAQTRLAMLNLDPAKADAQAAAILKKRLEERPDDPVALVRMVAVLVRHGRPDEAIGICEQALKTNAGSVPATLQLARLYVESKRNPERALVYARDARKLAPEDPEVAYAMGKVAYQCRDIAWAYGVLLDAARARPDQGDVLFTTAMAAYGVGRVTEAESLVQRALQQAGGFAQSNQARRFLTMTALWREPAKIGPASAQIGEELRADPNFVPTLMVVGMAHERARNAEEARKAYERALSVFPTFTPAMKELARLLVDSTGDTRRAFELALKAREAFPEDSEVARTFGIAAYRQGDFAAAAGALKDASRQRQNDAHLFFHLGMAQARLKQPAEGKRALSRALELDPNASFTAEARKALADLN
jgi:tetratricopeptide (TPR) repeat protein